MNVVKIILHIGILILFYLVGTWIQQALDLFIPGSIIGMLLLLVALLMRKFNPAWIHDGATLLINHLVLLFIPVTIGILEYLHLFSGRGLLLIPIVLVSTVLVMITAGFVSQTLVKRREKEYE
ncbi:CidA/LrgA family protein [Salirhabdus sp. Marseille-P4669]|uniref:CidA/LrgA family protein n=1 Tax=Salirhabdus sp. Marseille-P4669 TaxID=2042310 RepID=UPI000C7D05E4|nr:CidA/LrgA family holin-like protein [Salirhabdus sp. Marseille-P4669]